MLRRVPVAPVPFSHNPGYSSTSDSATATLAPWPTSTTAGSDAMVSGRMSDKLLRQIFPLVVRHEAVFCRIVGDVVRREIQIHLFAVNFYFRRREGKSRSDTRRLRCTRGTSRRSRRRTRCAVRCSDRGSLRISGARRARRLRRASSLSRAQLSWRLCRAPCDRRPSRACCLPGSRARRARRRNECRARYESALRYACREI